MLRVVVLLANRSLESHSEHALRGVGPISVARPHPRWWWYTHVKSARQVFLLLLGLALVSCTQPATNFSQFPGFATYFATHPARHVPPTPDEQRLLERHRPRFFLPPQHAGLIDFYSDYIASGTLYGADGTLLADQVTPGALNVYKTEPRVYFVHRPAPPRLTQPVVYARIERDVVDLAQFGQREFVFLTYNAVFRHSGLPASITGWRAMVLAAFASLDDWHQLDHYTAATVVLDETFHPVALVLQQHNYTHTYVFGRDLVLPADGHVLIDVAIRSNELYPHVSHRATRRAVRFLSPAAMRYLLGFGARPAMAADDVTDGQNEAAYTLGFLPPDDAFYTFQGFLGERRRLPGRAGPPGADYNISPTLKPWGIQVLVGFFREGDREELGRLEATYARTGNPLDFVRVQAPVFGAVLHRD